MPVSYQDHQFLYKIAKAYYLEGLTQQAIAKRFHISRPKVSRLIQRAREEKIVNITIVPPVGDQSDLENQLELFFGLDEAVVVPAGHENDPFAITRELGPPAAEVLLRSLQGQETIGLAWGRSIFSVVEAMPMQSMSELTIVQMIGGLGLESSNEHSAELVRKAAQKLNARFRLLSAPGIIANHAVLQALKADPQIAETLAIASRADVAVVGLGVLNPESVLLKRGEILNKNDLNMLKSVGAVGDVILRFLDARGKALDLDINRRILGLSLAQLKKIPRVIGVAGGREKLAIVAAALKAKVLNTLVTDAETAKQLIAQHGKA